MKHLKKLAYNTLQWEWREVLIIGLLVGTGLSIFTGTWIYLPVMLIVSFITGMIAEHYNLKKKNQLP